MPKKTFERLDEAKRNRIEHAAITVINDKGYDRTTIRDVVRAASIPRGSFYQYFNGMSDLFMHLLTVVSQQKMRYMQDLWDRLESSSFIKLYPDFIKSGLDFAYSNKEAYLFGYHLFHSNSEEVVNLKRMLEKQGVAMMEELLETDKRNGVLKKNVDTGLLAGLLYDFNARQLIYMVYEQESEDKIMEHAKAFLTIINYGIMNEEA